MVERFIFQGGGGEELFIIRQVYCVWALAERVLLLNMAMKNCASSNTDFVKNQNVMIRTLNGLEYCLKNK